MRKTSEKHIVKCAECGADMSVPKYINYTICDPCKNKLASTKPREVVEHLVKAAQQNEHAKDDTQMKLKMG